MHAAALALLAFPVAALLVAFFRLYPRRPELVHVPILASCAGVSAASLFLAWRVSQGASMDWTLYRWMAAGKFSVQFGFCVDGLSASVLAMVSVVGALIHAYAVGYMREDPGFGRFFLYFHLFYLSMVGLLVSNNYLQMYLFWEGVGLASYLLIGFWYAKESARKAALKAFLTNRVGDFGFMLGILILLASAGTVGFSELFGGLLKMGPRELTWAAMLFAWAAAAKSAQFPLYIWLPDAMEGPTPTSALMHAATMVTAGVFLLARSWPLLAMAPSVPPVLVAVGAGTALGAAVVASVKKDLKRILAYSTISHLGLMTMAVGLGTVSSAVFHLVIHGFFKALLFLCAGNILHGMGKPSADIDEVGGLRSAMPWTFACFGIGTLSLAGIYPMAGFFSKDRVMEAALGHGSLPLELAALLISVASAFYIFRMFLLVFFGPNARQRPAAHPHEAEGWMLAPVVLLAAGAALGGLLAAPFASTSGAALPNLSLGPSLFSLSAALFGAAAAWMAIHHYPDWDWEWRERHPGLAHWIEGDFGWQAFVLAAVVRPVATLAGWVARGWEAETWEPWVDSLGDRARSLAEAGAVLSTGLVNEYLWWLLAGTAFVAWLAR